MSNRSKFDPEDLDPSVLNNVLRSLSDYAISHRRMRIRETVVGKGGFGTVKLADLWSNSWIQFDGYPITVAVKQLNMENQGGTPLRIAVRLAREMKVWASCKHPNILEFTGYYLSNDFTQAYLISPYVKNGNIKDYLAREAPPLEQRLRLVFDTIKGLAYLHSSDPPVVHGDLKSLNVLVTDEARALLGDFGLARAMEEEPTGLSTSTAFKGTIRYCSPEVLQGSLRDRTGDIWSWGGLALEIITSNPPYYDCQKDTFVLFLICGDKDTRRTPEPTDTSSLPPSILNLLRECWSFDPTERPTAERCEYEMSLISLVH